MGDKLHRREGNSPDHQLRPLNDRSVIKEMNGAKRSAEAVGCKNASVGGAFRLRGKHSRERVWTKRKRECRLE
ncbi:hypothetical protein LINPERHAP2_LOCUS45742 [Linum perenne]